MSAVAVLFQKCPDRDSGSVGSAQDIRYTRRMRQRRGLLVKLFGVVIFCVAVIYVVFGRDTKKAATASA